MSVLETVNVQDGYAIRQLCSKLDRTEAKLVFKTVKNWKAHRMDTIEYSQPMDVDKGDLKDLCNAYWISESEDGATMMNWGTPNGSWNEYIGRMETNPKMWKRGEYLPTTAKEVDEGTARDLLLAGYLFPFYMDKSKTDPLTSHILLPVLTKIKPSKMHMGSRAVFKIISMFETDPEGPLAMFSRNTDEAPDFRELNDHMTYFSLGTSPNEHDALHGAARADTVDWERATHADRFVNMAGLANYGLSWLNRSHGGSRAAKRAKKMMLQRKQFELNHELLKMGGGIEYLAPWADKAYSMYVKGEGECFGKLDRKIPVSCTATSNLFLLRVKDDHFLLTDQDLLSIKFAAMSHSMWHLYSASLAVEYEKTDPVFPPGEKSKLAGTIAGELKTMVSEISKMKDGEQEIVPYATVTKALDELWTLYMDILTDALDNSMQDYIGRYLNELFSSYTDWLGGSLMNKASYISRKELEEEYSRFGFSVDDNRSRLIDILRRLPESAAQDFGRLSKIVPAYDVNPIYSFLDRASKMCKPNPRGHIVVKNELEANITPFNEAELEASDDKLRASCRVMLAISDIHSRAMDQLTPQEREEFKNDPFPTIVMKLKRMRRSLSTAATLRSDPDLLVPSNEMDEARKQARNLLNRGDMPTTPWAGAYLMTENMFAYNRRTDSDLAILKATAIVSSTPLIAMSNLSRVKRATPTRETDGERIEKSGTMITDFLLDMFPTRKEAFAFVSHGVCIASTSDKIETVKYPLKTRIITSMCAEGRRIQGEYEHNNGKVLVHVPGFMIGIPPADRLKRTYACLRDDVSPGNVRLGGSLDLSAYSQGMNWRVQTASNDVLCGAYGMSKSEQKILESCTLGTYMVRCESDIRLFMVNSLGSNYEGLDAKRNTFMHCAIWYIARCEAYSLGVEGSMRAFLYIDDGCFSMDVPAEDLDLTVTKVRVSLIKAYSEFGFKLNLGKTVISASYMQFLNEIFLHGVHIGYGFRALCHTGAQSFPEAATVSEELSVIMGGIRGSSLAGGQSLRLMVGLNFCIWLYTAGVIGNKGRSLANAPPAVLALTLFTPSNAGGFGIANWCGVHSNLSGHRDCEKLDRVASMCKLVRTRYSGSYADYKMYLKENLVRVRVAKPDMIPDRVSAPHPAMVKIGDMGRDMEIAKAALDISVNREATTLLTAYIRDNGKVPEGSITEILVKSYRRSPVSLPGAMIEKGLATNPHKAIMTLVSKVSSTYLINRLLSRKEIRAYNRKYFSVGKSIVANMCAHLV